MEPRNLKVYKYELIRFLNTIHRLDIIIPKEILDEVNNKSYHIYPCVGDSIDICDGARVVKTLRTEDLDFENITFDIVNSGYARCPKCSTPEITHVKLTPDKSIWGCTHCDWNATY